MGYSSKTSFSGKCDICGEPFDQQSPLPSLSEVAEFWVEEDNPLFVDLQLASKLGDLGASIVCHGQCGFDAGLEMA